MWSPFLFFVVLLLVYYDDDLRAFCYYYYCCCREDLDDYSSSHVRIRSTRIPGQREAFTAPSVTHRPSRRTFCAR